MAKVKLIAVSPENYDSLRRFGNFQESFNDVITKILDKVDALPNQKNRVTGGFEANRSQQLTEQSKSQGSEPIEND